MTTIGLDTASWDAGYRAGYEGRPNQATANLDPFSWSSGYVEGKGDRQMGKAPYYERVAKHG
jgi:hypothetical protein